MRELNVGLGHASSSGSHDVIRVLVRKGYLERVGPTGRSSTARNLLPTALAIEATTDQDGTTGGGLFLEQRCMVHEIAYFGGCCPACRGVRGF
jgi:hypothetical protein